MTLGLIRKIEFDGLFSFKYSDRKGTVAEKMKEKIDEQTKSSRLTTLQAIQKAITLNKNTAMEGSVAEVLVEGQSKRGGQLTGRTATDKIVNFDSNSKNIVGRLVTVKITEGFANSLRGQLMKP
jgi:tRNA-2-methylthio-N6-dimethylallyladenosine synthase